MKKMIENYLDEVKKNKPSKEDLLTHISFFQHERLIHLLVTIFTGIIAILLFLTTLFIENILIVILFLLMVCLFIPYIFHYYFLENKVQELYTIYDNLNTKKDK